MVDLRRWLDDFKCRPGATDSAIAESEKQLGVKLPEQYIDFMKVVNGGEGFIGGEYAILWGVEELASANQEYEFAKFLPEFLGFGSNGGGEAFGFDTRQQPWAVVQVPLVGLGWSDAWPMGDSFNAFLARLKDIA